LWNCLYILLGLHIIAHQKWQSTSQLIKKWIDFMKIKFHPNENIEWHCMNLEFQLHWLEFELNFNSTKFNSIVELRFNWFEFKFNFKKDTNCGQDIEICLWIWWHWNFYLFIYVCVCVCVCVWKYIFLLFTCEWSIHISNWNLVGYNIMEP